jgi:hypothetical protein
MPSRRKYNGPCPEHLEKKAGCKHCGAYYMQRRYHGGREPPPESKPAPSSSDTHTAPIYRGLHWPAPESQRG